MHFNENDSTTKTVAKSVGYHAATSAATTVGVFAGLVVVGHFLEKLNERKKD